MADLRIIDAPEIPTNNITGQEKIPTGGSGNYSITLDSVSDYTKTKKDLADKTYVDGKVSGVRQELDAHIEDLLNPHQVTKGQIGLGNVDNTADLDKPVSNSTQAAIISAVAPKADNDKVKRGIANRYDSSLTYNFGERIVLTNGDIVKSTINDNTNDPNVNMTGWVKTNSASQIFDASGKTQQQLTSFKPNFLNQTTAQPSTDVTAELQSFVSEYELDCKPAIEIPMNGFDYDLTAPVIIQEPTSIVGDKGATYDRGLGKKGWFLLKNGVTHGFDLGNYRKYQNSVYDPSNKISPNPADYWTVKNIGIKPASGVPSRTQDGLRLTTQTNGPDRALQINEVSLKRLDKAIYIEEMQGGSIVSIASLNVSDSVINLCNHGIYVNGRSFQSCIEGNQIEQNLIASVWGAFDGATRIINNIIEGVQPHGIVFTVPDDGWGSQNQAIIESHYFEGLTENCIQIEARNGSAYWLRGNKNYGTATKDYCLIKKGSRTNIYNAEFELITLEDGVTLNLNSELTKRSNYSLYFRPTVAAFSNSSFVHRLGQLKPADTSYTRFIPPFTRKITKVYDQLAYASEVNQSMVANLNAQVGDLLEVNVLVKCTNVGSANTVMNLTNAVGQIVSSFQLRLTAGEYAVGTILTRALIENSGVSYINVPSSDAVDLEIFGVAVKNHGAVTIGNRYLISPCQPALHTIAGKHAQKYEYAGVTVPANSIRNFDLVLSSYGEVGNLVQAALSEYVTGLEVRSVIRAGGVVQVTLRNTTAADIVVPACQVRVIVL